MKQSKTNNLISAIIIAGVICAYYNVKSQTTNYVPKWSGIAWVNTVTPIYEDATNSRIGIGTITPGEMFHVYKNISGNNWGGRGVFSGATYAVIAGQYANVPIVGAHNAALNAWANLYINWDGTSGSNVYMKGNLGIGTTSPGKLLDVNGDINIAQGSAYYLANNKILWYNSTSTTNIFAGVGAGLGNSTAINNTAFGYNTINSGLSGNQNTAIGFQALRSNNGANNTAVGANALVSNTDATDNTAMGYGALTSNTNSSRNTAIGSYSLLNFAYTGASQYYPNNTAIGYKALLNTNPSSTTNGLGNTALGSLSGNVNITGSYNTYLGYSADACAACSTITNATALGNGTIVAASNTIMFGNTSVVGWGFGATPTGGTDAIVVGTGATNGNGAHLTLGGVWTDISDKTKKDDITELDAKTTLDNITKMKITKWKYTGTNNEYHIGPMADDFHRLFSIGDEHSTSAMDKTGVLFLGVQELSAENKTQQEMIDDLKSTVKDLQSTLQTCCTANHSNENNTGSQLNATTIYELELANNAVLFQNTPNPFGERTIIKYFVPDNTNALIIFYDEFGNKLKEFIITEKGMGQLNLSAMNLTAGIYSYSLVMNGKIADTKKMVKIK